MPDLPSFFEVHDHTAFASLSSYLPRNIVDMLCPVPLLTICAHLLPRTSFFFVYSDFRSWLAQLLFLCIMILGLCCFLRMLICFLMSFPPRCFHILLGLGKGRLRDSVARHDPFQKLDTLLTPIFARCPGASTDACRVILRTLAGMEDFARTNRHYRRWGTHPTLRYSVCERSVYIVSLILLSIV